MDPWNAGMSRLATANGLFRRQGTACSDDIFCERHRENRLLFEVKSSPSAVVVNWFENLMSGEYP
jgi:hypothetical protein